MNDFKILVTQNLQNLFAVSQGVIGPLPEKDLRIIITGIMDSSTADQNLYVLSPNAQPLLVLAKGEAMGKVYFEYCDNVCVWQGH
jgi:hypothetical protein